MPRVGVRELKNNTSEIIRAVREKGAEYVVTVQGRPAAMIVPLAMDKEEWEDYVLANHPYFVERRQKAREAMTRGQLVTLEEAFANLDKRKRAARKKRRAGSGSPRRTGTRG